MRKILIVNDDKKLCKIFSGSDIGKDNELFCVSDENELIDKYDSLKPDLIILVSTFEEFNKYEFDFLLTVKSKFPKVPSVLVVTKLILPQFIPLFDLGIDSIISNYSSGDEIIIEIQKILETIY